RLLVLAGEDAPEVRAGNGDHPQPSHHDQDAPAREVEGLGREVDLALLAAVAVPERQLAGTGGECDVDEGLADIASPLEPLVGLHRLDHTPPGVRAETNGDGE